MKKFEIILKILILTVFFSFAVVFAGCTKSIKGAEIKLTILPAELNIDAADITSSNGGEFTKSGNVFTMQLEKTQNLSISIDGQKYGRETVSFNIRRTELVSGNYEKSITLNETDDKIIVELTIDNSGVVPEITGIDSDIEWAQNRNVYRAKIAKSKIEAGNILTVKAEGFAEYKLEIDEDALNLGYCFKWLRLVKPDKSLVSVTIKGGSFDYYYAKAISIDNFKKYNTIFRDNNNYLFIEADIGDILQLEFGYGFKYDGQTQNYVSKIPADKNYMAEIVLQEEVINKIRYDIETGTSGYWFYDLMIKNNEKYEICDIKQEYNYETHKEYRYVYAEPGSVFAVLNRDYYASRSLLKYTDKLTKTSISENDFINEKYVDVSFALKDIISGENLYFKWNQNGNFNKTQIITYSNFYSMLNSYNYVSSFLTLESKDISNYAGITGLSFTQAFIDTINKGYFEVKLIPKNTKFSFIANTGEKFDLDFSSIDDYYIREKNEDYFKIIIYYYEGLTLNQIRSKEYIIWYDCFEQGKYKYDLYFDALYIIPVKFIDKNGNEIRSNGSHINLNIISKDDKAGGVYNNNDFYELYMIPGAEIIINLEYYSVQEHRNYSGTFVFTQEQFNQLINAPSENRFIYIELNLYYEW